MGPSQLNSTIMPRRYRTEPTLQNAQSLFRTGAWTNGIGVCKVRHGLAMAKQSFFTLEMNWNKSSSAAINFIDLKIAAGGA